MEHDIQVACIEWCLWSQSKYPGLEYIFAIPNGGHRHIGTAIRLKNEGVKPGVPDLFLPVAKRNFNGLFLEIKTPKGAVSKPQEKFMSGVISLGFLACIIRSIDDFTKTIEWYYD